MRHFYSLCTVCLCLPSAILAQDDGYFGPITRWNTSSKPVEPGTTQADSLSKLTTELAEVKNRLKTLEESQSNYTQHTKSQFQSMNDSIKAMQAYCERLHQEGVTTKPTITQTSALMPATKPVEDSATKLQDATMKRFDDIAKRMDDISTQLQDMTKLNLQVQGNTRDLNELKKKTDTQERDLIQAQSDIGKLQQDLARMTRPGGSSLNPTDNTRSSMALPLPPGTSATATSAVKLVNSYPASVTVIVDGQFYTLRSYDSLTLNKSPGTFTYEVLGIQGNTLRTLGTAETLTIQIVPR
ncbi:MAG: hypothetical protein U0796_11830 [Gemmatales bacterium]